MNPTQYFGGCGEFEAVGLRRPVDHEDRQSKGARGLQLSVGARAAGVFGHDQINVMRFHQRAVGGLGEGATINHDLGFWQRQRRFGRIDKTQKIAVLRVWGEFGQVHPTDSEHDVFRGARQGCNGGRDVGHMGPVIARVRGPRRAGEGDHWRSGSRGGGGGVVTHGAGEGVRGVDEVRDSLRGQVVREAIDPAEAPNALGQGLAHGAIHAAGETHGALKACIRDGARKGCGLGRAAKDQEVGVHG